MKINKFNESNNLDKLNKEDTFYTLWGEKTKDKNGNLYPNIKTEKLAGGDLFNGTLEKCVHFYKLHKDYNNLFITKTVSKTEVLSQEDIDILLDTKKYNI